MSRRRAAASALLVCLALVAFGRDARKIAAGVIKFAHFNHGDARDLSYLNQTPTVSGANFSSTARVATFDGVNDLLSWPHDATQNAMPLSVSAWVDMQSAEQVQYASIVDKYVSGSGNGWGVWVDTSERIRAWYFAGSVANSIYGGGDGTLLTTSGYRTAGWTHVAVVFATSGGTIYINGVSADTQAWTGSAGQSTSTHRLALGESNAFGGRFFAGAIDDVRIFNRELTANEVTALFAGGRM